MIAAVAVLLAHQASAEATVRIGYQTAPDPSQVAIVDGEYEKAAGTKIEWRKFESGASVIAALASGSIDIGYAGSSPLAAGVTRGAPIKAFLIAGLIGEAEALVARDGAGINEPKDLVGKKVAVPFVSTTHYSLLFALKHWGIDASTVNILNLQPPEIAAAFARGDIDATYVWDPALASAKKSGKVLITSAQVADLGGPSHLCRLDCPRRFRQGASGDRHGLHQGDPGRLHALSQGSGRVRARHGRGQEDRRLHRR